MSAPTSPPPAVARKHSVSISEPAKDATSPSHSSTSITPASGKLDPKKVCAQLLASIPEKEKQITKGWKVKQVVLTRLDQGHSAPSIQGVNVAPSATSATTTTTTSSGGIPPMLGKLKKMGTSKMHKFTPSASIEQALEWLSEYGSADSSVLFENNCAFMFERGAFLEFEDLRDDDDDE